MPDLLLFQNSIDVLSKSYLSWVTPHICASKTGTTGLPTVPPHCPAQNFWHTRHSLAHFCH